MRAVVAGVTAALLASTAAALVPTAHATGAKPHVIDGPDVASYQHPSGAAINWRRVARANADFGIVKATEGTSYTNPWFHRDYSGIRAAGLVRGSYHFARPAHPLRSTALRQAKYYVAAIGSSPTTTRTLPPALDLEVTGGLSRAELVTWAQTFLLEVRKLTDRTPMLYTYPYFWTGSLGDAAALARFPLWMASYSSGVGTGPTLWQYTSGARLSGIRGAVDMSRLVADRSTWTPLSDGSVPTAWPATPPGPPQEPAAQAHDGAASITWMPGDSGSADISSYTVTASPGGATATVDGVTHHATVTGLTDGTAYRFTVAGANKAGTGVASAATATVTPMVPTALTVQAPASVGYGHDVVVHARLSHADTGKGAAGRQITVAQQTSGGQWTSLPAHTTSANGRITVTLPAQSANSALRLRLHAPRGWRKASATVAFAVHRRVSARLASARVAVHQAVTLAGHVTPALEGLPARRQRLEAGRWRTVASTTVNSNGHYVFRFSFSKKGHATYRVVVPARGTLANGVSATRQLTVH